MSDFLTRLRAANEARQLLWDVDNQVDLDWRVNELSGEAGEVCNVMKKLHRERVEIPGSRATRDDLAEELSDVVICCDLVAMTNGDGPFTDLKYVRPFGKLTTAGIALMGLVGQAADDQYHGQPVQFWRMHLIVSLAFSVGRHEGLDMEQVVAAKFNATSMKVGLPTRLTVN